MCPCESEMKKILEVVLKTTHVCLLHLNPMKIATHLIPYKEEKTQKSFMAVVEGENKFKFKMRSPRSWVRAKYGSSSKEAGNISRDGS